MSQSAYIKRRGSNRETTTNLSENSGDTSMLSQRLTVNKGLRSPSPSRRFEVSNPGTKLAQEIHDEFLVCKICLECYKNPKSLNCLHTFCENCIENHVMSESTYKKYSDYREFTCPLCRKRTQLPIGGVKKLPDNFLVSSLSEVVSRGRPSKFPFCDICKLVNRKHREATSKCLDCAKLLCKNCVDLHKETKVTASHSIFDVEIEKDVECKEHQDEVVRFYCEPCETCICVLCTFNEHKDHEITQFGEAVTKYKDSIKNMLDSCKNKIDKFDGQIDSLNKCEEVIKAVEQRIHDTAIQFISDIRTREKQLVEELKNVFGKETMDYIENKKDLSTSVDGLRSTCNLTEVILKGKDIELLLLKKEVQAKLSSLGEVEIKSLPDTINKQVNFVSGTINFGYIQDLDRPLLSKMLPRKFGEVSQEESGALVSLANAQTQTDESLLPKGGRNERDEDSEDESDSEEESEEETESEEEEAKPETEEKGVQTDKPPGEKKKDTMKDEGTTTDRILTEEKAVNTRSRSLQSLSTMRRSPPKDNNEDSLAARRRRRRERVQSATIGGYNSQSLDIPDSSTYNDDTFKRRSRFLSNHSIEHEDMFYDAPS